MSRPIVTVEFGGRADLKGIVRQVGEDQIVKGYCDRCGANTTLARYWRQQPEPERFTAVCESCLIAMLKSLVIHELEGD